MNKVNATAHLVRPIVKMPHQPFPSMLASEEFVVGVFTSCDAPHLFYGIKVW